VAPSDSSSGGATTEKHTVPSFLGRPDAPVLDSLSHRSIQAVRKGTGGRSLAFRITLADGTQAYVKPRQSFAAHWYSEVAAYHVDRGLGLGRVPPVVSRSVPWTQLQSAAQGDWRVGEMKQEPNGRIKGAFIAWIEVELLPLDLPTGWERWLRYEPLSGASPFQPVPEWKEAQRTASREDPGPPRNPRRPPELSDLVVFDYLIGNMDRWGGDFTNVRTLGADGPLVFIDNANGFHRGGRKRYLDAQVEAVHKFRESTLAAVERFDATDLERRLEREPLSPILDDEALRGFEARRNHLLSHVRDTQARFGKRATPW
jgi:hypothetical protein